MSDKNIRLRDVESLLKGARELHLSSLVIKRLRWLAFYAGHDGNVSLTCRHFCIARPTLLKWIRRFDPHDPSSLEERSRRPHHMRSPETEESTIRLIESYRKHYPSMGKAAISGVLLRNHGISVSSSTVGRIITRHCFFFGDIPSHREKRRNSFRRHELECNSGSTDAWQGGGLFTLFDLPTS